MLNCTIYKYLLRHNEGTNLFNSGTASTRPNIDLRKYFGSLFHKGTQLNIYKTKDNGDNILHPNEVLNIHDDIILMRICNEKKVSVVQDYKERKEPSYPWCYLIIDNRPGKGYIIIEKSSSFYGETNHVRDLLTSTFTRLMYRPDQGLDIEIEINAKLVERDFWQFVNERINTHRDHVSKFTFEFPNPDKNQMIDAPEATINLLKALTLTGIENGYKGHYSMVAEGNAGIRFHQTLNNIPTDFANMVGLCLRHGYELSVNFRNYGEFQYSQATALNKEMLSLNPDYIHQFQTDPAMILTDGSGYDLIDWLNEQEEYVKNLKDENQTITRRQKSNKR